MSQIPVLFVFQIALIYTCARLAVNICRVYLPLYLTESLQLKKVCVWWWRLCLLCLGMDKQFSPVTFCLCQKCVQLAVLARCCSEGRQYGLHSNERQFLRTRIWAPPYPGVSGPEHTVDVSIGSGESALFGLVSSDLATEVDAHVGHLVRWRWGQMISFPSAVLFHCTLFAFPQVAYSLFWLLCTNVKTEFFKS